MPCTVFGSTFALFTSQLLRLWRRLIGDENRRGEGNTAARFQGREHEVPVLRIGLSPRHARRWAARIGCSGTYPSDASVLVSPSLPFAQRFEIRILPSFHSTSDQRTARISEARSAEAAHGFAGFGIEVSFRTTETASSESPKHPDFAFASCAEPIGSGDASARELQQIATFDAEKLSRLVGRDKRLRDHGHLPRHFGSDNRCRSGESFVTISSFSSCGRVQRLGDG